MFPIKTPTALLLLMVCVSCGSVSNKTESKPNILFLFADDQSYNTINALGNEEVITPTLDHLVKSGVSFTHAYNMGAWHGAVCVASRTMMSTGRMIWRANDLVPKLKDTTVIKQLWGNIMKNAGYDTYMAGKWHVATDVSKCYANLGTIRPGMPPHIPEGYNRPQSKNDTTWRAWDKKWGGYWQGGKHWSEVLADETIGFIETAAKKDKPFFMYVAFNAPHDPRQSPKEFVDMYPLENISAPKTFLPEYPYKDAIGCDVKLRDEALAPFPRTEYAVRVNRQEYYALITHLDKQIGRIIDALKKSGEMDNTYIFYTADHGLACGNYGLMGKQNMYDCSIRPPLIVIGPDIPKDKRVDLDVYLQDIMPSTLELAGVVKPTYVEFSSLLKQARGEKKESEYEAVYGCYMQSQRMIRNKDYKLILYPEVPKVLLFDLKADPLEMNDLSDNEAYSDTTRTLFKQLLVLQQQMGDTLNLRTDFPSLYQP
ncbi:MAG: sulfatase-like hydrolase/transferase [Bacteroidales bacterium]